MSHPKSKSHLMLTLWCLLLAVVLLLTGLFYSIGGVQLIRLGGSWYFLLTGLITIAAAILVFRKKALGIGLFGLVFLITLIWAVWDAGWDFWGLFSRLMFPAGVFAALLFTLPALRRYQQQSSNFILPAYATGSIVVIGMLVAFYQMFQPHPTVRASGQELALLPVDATTQQVNWQHYGNDTGGSRFAALDQINRNNVQHLKEVWRYRTGDLTTGSGNGAEDQSTPLQVGNKVFLCTPHNNIIALNVDTGQELWKAEVNSKTSAWERCRGVAYFDATQPIEQPSVPGSSPVLVVSSQICPRRVYTNTADGRLIAVNADTGERCKDFGTDGTVDLIKDLGENSAPPLYEATSAPTLAGSVIVVGGRVADNYSTDMPSGVIRAFDVITGKLRWAFDSRNPDPNYVLKPGEHYQRGSTNTWAPMSYDAKMNTVFLPMGSSAIDLWGGKRNELDHKYNTSVLALDATTGKEKWVYQTVHNDLWDFDLPMQPSLVDFPIKDGRTKPAVVIGTKSGQFFVLDRLTGKPLTKVIEQPVPQGALSEEHYSATQPRSVEMPQIGNQTLTESDMWGATPFDQLMCRINFKSMRYEGLFTPPGKDISLTFPGSLGGMNWGSITFDPTHRYLFVNDMRLGLWLKLEEMTAEDLKKAGSLGEKVSSKLGSTPMEGTPYKVTKNRFMSALGIPCQKPPFGTMTAIDMKTRKIVWQIPMGTVQDTGPLGIKMGLPVPIGMPTIGGSMATQGGLLFFAATQDYYLRALDSSNGQELWKARLPVGSQGTPITYLSPDTHKQYVVISAGGARQSPDHGDYVIAYALDNQHH